jgi:hypothetical protein
MVGVMADEPEGGKKGFLSGDVKIPGTKAKVPKVAAAGGIALVGVFAIMYYRKKKAGTAAAGTGATVTDPDGNVCAALAPSGYCPGSPGDLNAQGQGYAGGLQGGGGIIGYDSNGNPVYGTPTGTQVTNGPPFTSDAAWSQYVITQLGGTVDALSLTNALGAYIDGAQDTAAQEQLIQDAIAIAGTPPVAGPNGFPPSINVGGTKDHHGPKPTTPTALMLKLGGPTTIDATWRPGRNATSYMFQITPKDPAAHDIGDRTDYSAGGLKPDTTYTVRVAGKNAQGTSAYTTKTIKTGPGPKPRQPGSAPTVNPGGLPIGLRV